MMIRYLALFFFLASSFSPGLISAMEGEEEDLLGENTHGEIPTDECWWGVQDSRQIGKDAVDESTEGDAEGDNETRGL